MNKRMSRLHTISSSSPLVGNTTTMAGFEGYFFFSKVQGGDIRWSACSRSRDTLINCGRRSFRASRRPSSELRPGPRLKGMRKNETRSETNVKHYIYQTLTRFLFISSESRRVYTCDAEDRQDFGARNSHQLLDHGIPIGTGARLRNLALFFTR
jgi:hypothetical protein